MEFEREVWQAFITNNSGDVQPNAQITVFDAGTSNLSTIYSSLTGAPRPNPFNTGSDGLAKFYAEPARYRVQAQTPDGIAVFDDVDLSQKALREDLSNPGGARLVLLEDGKNLQEYSEQFSDEALQQAVNNAQTEADRAETAAEQAAAAGLVYETSAAGQSDPELINGDYFWVVSASDTEVLELWIKGASSPTDTGKRTVSSTAVPRPLDVNSSAATFPQRKSILSDGLRGPELADGTAETTPVFDVANGELVVITGGSTATTRYFFTGHKRQEGLPLVASATYRRSDSGVGRAVIGVGNGSETVQYEYETSGTLYVRDSENNVIGQLSGSASGGSSVAVGEEYTISVYCDKNGDGYITGSKDNGNLISYPVTGVPIGDVRFGWRSSSQGEVIGFTAVYVDETAPVNQSVIAATTRGVNVLPGDFTSDTEILNPGQSLLGWSPNIAGRAEIIDFNGRKALRFNENSSMIAQVSVPDGEHKLSYHLQVDALTNAGVVRSNTDYLFRFLDENGTTISEENVLLQKHRESESIQGVIDIPSGTDNVLVAIRLQDPNPMIVSHASVVFGDILGFVPYSERVSSDDSGLNDPVYQRYYILPDSEPDRFPAGFTCTGLDRITRGDFAGCWLVGDDGRFREAQSDVQDPKVHIVTPCWSRILKTFPMPYTAASVQGVVVQTSGPEDTFWVATAGDRNLRHFNLYGESAGEEIVADRFNWDDAGFEGNPNGLAYDEENDALWAGMIVGGLWRLISTDPNVSPRVMRETNVASGLDQAFYDQDEKILYATSGPNGEPGDVFAWNTVTDEKFFFAQNLLHAEAIEGIYIDKSARIMTIMSDAGFHWTGKPALNIAIEYKV